MDGLYALLGSAMGWCYGLCGNYGLAIMLFTFCSKLALLPVSLWTYFNSIKMVQIQPDINFLKAKYYGQPDIIAEGQAKVFREKGYHPVASAVPTIIQLVLLVGVAGAIREGIRNPAVDMSFGPVDFSMVPAREGMGLLWIPAVAGLSSWILCMAQNASNVLQAEQTRANKYGTMALSVGLSLYLGWLVPVGTAFYWVCSNLMAVLQLYLLNWMVKPGRSIDYGRLEESRRQLAELQAVGRKKKEPFFSENRRRERADYKRFFSVVNKHLVFYSESNGFYKYFKGFIEFILENTDITIHYITSDPDDAIFGMAAGNRQVRGYYIGENRLITLMMRMDADVVVMTMPDLGNFHIKRSYVRDDVEYIFVQHGMGSNNMGMRKGCVDHFDTIFCAGPHQREEVRQTEQVYGLAKKKLVNVGYPLIDGMREEYQRAGHVPGQHTKILIAPSWQRDNIVDSCLEGMLDALKGRGYEITVRPHPQEVRQKQEYMQSLKRRYEGEGIEIQTDFTSSSPVLEADLLITDWSGISWEYAFVRQRPVLFIDTPMKVMNPEYQKISTVPLNILLRDKIGKSLRPDEMGRLPEAVDGLLSHAREYQEAISGLAQRYIYNPGRAAEVGGKYIIEAIQEKIAKRRAD